MDKLLGALAGIITDKPQELLTSLKKTGENGEEWLSEEDLAEKLKAAAIAKLQNVGNSQHQRGVRERAEKITKTLRDKYGLKSDKTEVEDLLEDLVANVRASAAAEKGEDFTEEKAAKNEIVKGLILKGIETATKGQSETIDKLTKELETIRKSENDQKLRSAIEKHAAELKVVGFNPGDDPELRKKRLDTFQIVLERKAAFKFDGENPIPVNDKGEQLETPNTFVKIGFMDLLKEVNSFPTSTQTPSNGSPSPTNQPLGGGSGGGIVVNSQDELDKFLAAERNPQKRLEAIQSFRKAEAAKSGK